MYQSASLIYNEIYTVSFIVNVRKITGDIFA